MENHYMNAIAASTIKDLKNNTHKSLWEHYHFTQGLYFTSARLHSIMFPLTLNQSFKVGALN